MRGREFLRNMMTLRQWVNEDGATRDGDQRGADNDAGQDGPDEKGRSR
jgi:hypothetical protein